MHALLASAYFQPSLYFVICALYECSHSCGIMTYKDELDHVPSEDVDSVDERKLVMKMDMRIVPIFVLIYITAFIDRYVCEL